MHFLAALRELPISLILTSLALVSKAIPVQSSELTPDNFNDSTAKGLWFIEFYSPYCGHCREFAPTWKQLVEEAAHTTPSVKLAQVNCAVHGDLCNEKGVPGYPTLRMYHDGKDLEKFTGHRELPALHAFIKRHADAFAPKTPPPPAANPNGEVLELTDATFATNLAKGPMFVKFFAPWCGHCKKLAPVWRQLAKHMKGKLNVAEVNCDDHSALCKANNVQGYPTLIYLTSGGLRSEYNGGRKLEQLKTFAEKASSAALRPIKTEELDGLIKENEVVYLLIHSSSDKHILETVGRVGTVLLGSPPLVTSSDPSLLTRFSVPETSTWALIAFKDHDPETPSSVFHERAASSDEAEAIKTWLLTHRLPTTTELTQDTFQNVMNAPQAPLVVIAAYGPATKDKIAERVRELGNKWRARTKGSGLTPVKAREVVLTWMDAEKWKAWMKSMYAIADAGTETELDDVRVVIADHKRLVYYDQDTTDSRLKLTSSASLFAAVEAAAAGTLAYKHSENIVERFARYLNHKMVSLETYVVTHPWRAVFFVVMAFVAMFMGLRRLLADEAPGEYRKVDRLD
ncbi:putative thioredoxin [Lyophyllum shimeji]|uniref:Thioredoxin n=1 Tax=Lyophyllum shimeji TaxID=47721 RepID=A0A9P3UHV6_LYOSH|nr:putative thioredoxin [Lyophyllum shimeji]